MGVMRRLIHRKQLRHNETRHNVSTVVSLSKPVNLTKSGPRTRVVDTLVTLRVSARVAERGEGADLRDLLEQEVASVVRNQLAYPDGEREPGDLVQAVLSVETTPF